MLYITGQINVTIEGLRITGGRIFGENGGGVVVITATTTLNNNQIFNNHAANGGGIFAFESEGLKLDNNVIENNTVDLTGSGAYFIFSPNALLNSNVISGNDAQYAGGLYFVLSDDATLNDNSIINNRAFGGGHDHFGGGLYCQESHNIMMTDNIVQGNESKNTGGGLYFDDCNNIQLIANTVESNNSGGGGGLHIGGKYSDTALIENVIINNKATRAGGGADFINSNHIMLVGNIIMGNKTTALESGTSGGGLNFNNSTDVSLVKNIINQNSSAQGSGLLMSFSNGTMTNNVIVDNTAAVVGSGLYVDSSTLQLYHTTIAGNSGGDGSGVYITGTLSTLNMTNTVLVSHSIGITATSGNTVTLDGILWYNNGQNYAGDGTINVTNEFTGDPAFDEDGYHLTPASAAVDRGMSTDVDEDIDGLPRPHGGPDLGADEVTCFAQIESDPTTTYGTVQAAIDAANNGDTVKVAGICTRMVQRDGVTQIGYINKNITLRGGYMTTNWTVSDPVANPTTLDAQAQGRGLYITGDISPTIEGLRITGGNAELGSGTPVSGGGAGGGIHIISATVTLRNNQIFSNIANVGGGLSFGNSPGVMLIDNTVSENRTSGPLPQGGGLFFFTSPGATLIGNTIISNTAGCCRGYKSGGGLSFLFSDDVTLTSNVIRGNLAPNAGGGLDCWRCTNIGLTDNIISGNRSGHGGGLLFRESTNIRLTDNIISDNVGSRAGGLSLSKSTGILINNIIADNQKDLIGSGEGIGLYITDSSLHLLHTTIARNGGTSGVYVTNSGGATSSVTLTNTILVSHSVGISVTAGNTATLNHVLWYNNDSNTGGAGTITITNSYTGNPAFEVDGYHLTASSMAIDRGVNSSVSSDIDSDPRPIGLGYDLGADEFPAALIVTKRAAPDPVQAGAILTYTIWVTNTGNVTLTAVVTDILPEHVTPTGPLAWAPIVSIGETWIQTVPVTVEWGYAGPLTNVVQVTTAEGATETYTKTSEAVVVTPTKVTISGPMTGVVDTAYTFTATVNPPTATLPIAYTWSPTPSSGQGTPTATYTWTKEGVKTIAVTATNAGGTVSDIYPITITDLPRVSVTKTAFPDPVQAGESLTYTIRVNNTGGVDLHATITDTLPTQVIPQEILTWTPTITASGGVWVGQVVVTVTPGYSGTLTNKVEVTTEEGAMSSASVTVCVGSCVYLPIVLK